MPAAAQHAPQNVAPTYGQQPQGVPAGYYGQQPGVIPGQPGMPQPGVWMLLFFSVVMIFPVVDGRI